MKTRSTMVSVAVFVSVFLVLIGRLWQLQIIEGEKYLKASEANKLRIETLVAPRGIIYDRNGTPLVNNTPYYVIALRPEMKDTADTAAIAEFLGLDEGFVKRRISESKSEFEPIWLKEVLDFDELAYLEARLSDYPYLSVDVDLRRDYIYGNTASHLIGYIGRLTPSQKEKPGYEGVPPEAFIGQWGVERLFDERLRGTPGERAIEVDALGRELRVISETPPVKGEDLYLSMDLNMQLAAEKAFGDKAGAFIAMDPRNGEVLSMVSRPAFDPNLFSRGISYEAWNGLITDERHPMLNRVFQSRYPPGSTFKIATATAALETKAVTPSTEFICKGVYRFSNWTYRCWKRTGHGVISLHRAIVESCDIYFYQAGGRTGIDNIAKYARALGLDSTSGLGLVDEKKGIVPDTAWKRRVMHENWYLGETFHTSIGQGFVTVTPYEVASMTSAIANGGFRIRPTLLRKEGEVVAEETGISADTIKRIQSAMKDVVNSLHGTARASRSKYVEIAGKTGTAQVVAMKKGSTKSAIKDHAWFTAYAPVENPEIALSVIVEHGGHGGSAAAPIATKAIEAFYGYGEQAARNENPSASPDEAGD